MALEPGMVLARPVLAGEGGNPSIRLAVGSELTAGTIAQLVNKGIECVAVEREPPDAENYRALVAQYANRLHEIFGPQPDVDCQPLFDALLKDGPCEC